MNVNGNSIRNSYVTKQLDLRADDFKVMDELNVQLKVTPCDGIAVEPLEAKLSFTDGN